METIKLGASTVGIWYDTTYTKDIVKAVQYLVCKITGDSFCSRSLVERLYSEKCIRVKGVYKHDRTPHAFNVSVKYEGKSESMAVPNIDYEEDDDA